ncbi:YciI family protein [Arthrobacter sp. NEB 688]|uniref:YciI family protein n=1 Tax=Arthrobacter sp. NEB 688 TaxID=904039 RepID=UPI0015644EB4|nr:YciI family protein [Arthrobacter sp. NEB 688]QKE83498.1 hypothetical protein HL663_05760 [Arthrobacter sp. NEB 688]
MTRYVVLVAYEPAVWSEASPEVQRGYSDAHHAFERYVDEHGRRISGAPLADADTATTLGPGAGAARTVTDGPFVELTEQVGGYYDVELPDLDAVIAAARLLPSTYTVEIRPVVEIPDHAPL